MRIKWYKAGDNSWRGWESGRDQFGRRHEIGKITTYGRGVHVAEDYRTGGNQEFDTISDAKEWFGYISTGTWGDE